MLTLQRQAGRERAHMLTYGSYGRSSRGAAVEQEAAEAPTHPCWALTTRRIRGRIYVSIGSQRAALTAQKHGIFFGKCLSSSTESHSPLCQRQLCRKACERCSRACNFALISLTAEAETLEQTSKYERIPSCGFYKNQSICNIKLEFRQPGELSSTRALKYWALGEHDIEIRQQSF